MRLGFRVSNSLKVIEYRNFRLFCDFVAEQAGLIEFAFTLPKRVQRHGNEAIEGDVAKAIIAKILSQEPAQGAK